MRCPWGSSPRLAGWAVIVVVACLHGASVFARAADLPPVDDPTAAMDVPRTVTTVPENSPAIARSR